MLNYFKNLGTDNSPYWESVNKEQATHFSHSLLVYGDYCNTGAVGKANVQTILNDEALCSRTGCVELNEAYNTTSLMFPIEALNDVELSDLLESLDNYPSLDDDLMFQIEHDMENEAWESYGRRNFAHHLSDLGHEADLSNEMFDEMFHELSSLANYSIGHVDGDSWYFDFERMGGISKTKLTEYLDSKLSKNGRDIP